MKFRKDKKEVKKFVSTLDLTDNEAVSEMTNCYWGVNEPIDVKRVINMLIDDFYPRRRRRESRHSRKIKRIYEPMIKRKTKTTKLPPRWDKEGRANKIRKGWCFRRSF